MSEFWRLFEITNNEWWVADSSGLAINIEPALGELLWMHHGLLELPFRQAIHTAEDTKCHQPFVDLRILGVTTRYIADSESQVTHLRYWFSGAESQLRSSPEVLVFLSGSADIERLHRSVLNERQGVVIRDLGVGKTETGRSDIPVFPPLQATPFLNRFTAFHAALISFGPRSLLVCGSQRAGKTTTAIVVEREIPGAIVLADELVLIDEAAQACGVPIPLRERGEMGRVPRPTTASYLTGRKVRVTDVAILTAGDVCVQNAVLDTQEAIRLITPHVRPLADENITATASLLELVRSVEVWSWGVRDWPLLETDLRSLIRTIGERRL